MLLYDTNFFFFTVSKGHGHEEQQPFASSEQTDGFSSDGQIVVVSEGSQRLVKQLLSDRLQTA